MAEAVLCSGPHVSLKWPSTLLHALGTSAAPVRGPGQDSGGLLGVERYVRAAGGCQEAGRCTASASEVLGSGLSSCCCTALAPAQGGGRHRSVQAASVHRCTRLAQPLALPNTHVALVVPPICTYRPVFLSRRLHDCSGARATLVQSNSHCLSSCLPHRCTWHMLLFQVVAAVPSEGLSGGLSNTTAVISHGPSAARLHCLVPVAHSTPSWCMKDFGVDQLGSGEGRAGQGESLAV